MNVYRCCSEEEIKSYKSDIKYISDFSNMNLNTFNYSNDKKYIHFFFYPESCIYFSKLKPDTPYKIIFCIMPINLLMKNFGYGYYNNIEENKYIPLPEFCIPIDDFNLFSIKSYVSLESIECYFEKDMFNKYLKNLPDKYKADENGNFYDNNDQYSILNMSRSYLFKSYNINNKKLRKVTNRI